MPAKKRARIEDPTPVKERISDRNVQQSTWNTQQHGNHFFETASERVKRRRKIDDESTRTHTGLQHEHLAVTAQNHQKQHRQPIQPQHDLYHTNNTAEEDISAQPGAADSVSNDGTPTTAHHIDQALRDEEFARDFLAEVRRLTPGHDDNFGLRQMKRVSQLLIKAKRATQEEAPWLTADQAADYVKPGRIYKGPIFVDNQQPHELVSVDQFLSELYDDSAKIWIQNAAAPSGAQSTQEVSVAEVKERLRNASSKYPWNCLELACPFDDGIRPRFLSGSDCRLLTKIKVPPQGVGQVSMKAGRRQLEPGYKEAEKWALLAEAGSLTEPHQDSHGMNTYITVNAGQLGFGWLHQPSTAAKRAWLKSPLSFNGGVWRYVVLQPGQTVYFPAGTVHFVFRLRNAGHTLAFGGFVLRCSTIARWVQTMVEELKHPWITNEDLTTSTIGYLEQVERFVLQANADEQERWGGEQAIKRFLKAKKEYMGLVALRRS